jgi:hypothetical protein
MKNGRIDYKLNNTISLTPCPFNENYCSEIPGINMVGSIACKESCDEFVSVNEEEKYVICKRAMK